MGCGGDVEALGVPQRRRGTVRGRVAARCTRRGARRRGLAASAPTRFGSSAARFGALGKGYTLSAQTIVNKRDPRPEPNGFEVRGSIYP